MLSRVPPNSGRVVEFRRPGDPAQPVLSICPRGEKSLTSHLATLRAEMDGLTSKFSREYGRASEAAVRAEQISHAIQRLEWALERDDDPPPQAG